MLALLLAVPLLVFRGNVGLVEDVYQTVLDLPAETKANRPMRARSLHGCRSSCATPATCWSPSAPAPKASRSCKRRRSRLDKTIFLGGGALETLRLRLELNLSDDIFNKPELERQLRALGRRLGLGEFAYEVFLVAHVEPPAFQLPPQGIGQPPPEQTGRARPYELYVLVQPGVLRPGIARARSRFAKVAASAQPTSRDGCCTSKAGTGSADAWQVREAAGSAAADFTSPLPGFWARPSTTPRDRHGTTAVAARPRLAELPPARRLALRDVSIRDAGGGRAAPVAARASARRIERSRGAAPVAVLGGAASRRVSLTGARNTPLAHSRPYVGVSNSVGLGAHLLIIDEFQLDAGYGVGWASGGKFDSGGALSIRQAF